MPELTPDQQAELVVPEGIRRARAAFLRDFPRLMADRATRGRYICYHNDTLVAVAKDYRAAVSAAIAKGIPEDASLIVKVSPAAAEEERAFLGEPDQ